MFPRRLKSSSAPMVAVLFGVGGLVWIAANLLLARQLDQQQYAYVALFLAVTQTAGYIGPLGADGLARRQQLPLSPSPLPRVGATSTLVGVVAAAICAAIYRPPGALMLIVPVTVVAVAVGGVATAELQGRGRFMSSLVIMQGQSLMLLVAVAAAFLGLDSAWESMLVYTLGCAALAAWGWNVISSSPRGTAPLPTSWKGAGALVLIHGAGLVMLQLERFITPLAVSMGALATFGVLAATASAPFRMLHLALGYVLVPELRLAGSLAERRSVLRKELLMAVAFAIAAAVGVWLFVPVFVEIFLKGKYELSGVLIAGAILVGIWRFASVLVTSIVYALGDHKELVKLGLTTWAAVIAATLLGAIAGRWGLTGVVYGVGLGAVILAAGAAPMARSCLRRAIPSDDELVGREQV